MMHVRTIQAADTYALRLLVLRPGGTLKDADYANDSASATFHLGAESDGRIISVGSFYAEERAELPGSKQYRLRGMATHPDFRGQGFGAALMRSAFDHLRSLQADRLWCNARLRAVPFYERLGLITEGPEFDIPGIGGHFLMHRAI
ncbi:MAG TPA: GNAT family N-acetyltransferase [Flavobacteriales bacterium]|nr:GNAT family N-acetyltransferase [Flavobacteriales bacterium]